MLKSYIPAVIHGLEGLFERNRWMPAEFVLDFFMAPDNSGIIDRADLRLFLFDFDGYVEHAGESSYNILDRPPFTATDIVYLPAFALCNKKIVRSYYISHVDKVSYNCPVADMNDRFFGTMSDLYELFHN